MSRVALPEPFESALTRGLPAVVDLVAAALPPALAIPLGGYRSRLEGAVAEWTRALIADALCPPTNIDASAGAAPVADVRE